MESVNDIVFRLQGKFIPNYILLPNILTQEYINGSETTPPPPDPPRERKGLVQQFLPGVQQRDANGTLLFNSDGSPLTDETMYERAWETNYSWGNPDPYAPYYSATNNKITTGPNTGQNVNPFYYGTSQKTNDGLTRGKRGSVGANLQIHNSFTSYYIQSAAKDGFQHDYNDKYPGLDLPVWRFFMQKPRLNGVPTHRRYRRLDDVIEDIIRAEIVGRTRIKLSGTSAGMNSIRIQRWEMYGFSQKMPRTWLQSDQDFSILVQWHDLRKGADVDRQPCIALWLSYGILGVATNSSHLEFNTQQQVYKGLNYKFGAPPTDVWVDYAFRIRWDYRLPPAKADGGYNHNGLDANDNPINGFEQTWDGILEVYMRYPDYRAADGSTVKGTNGDYVRVLRYLGPNCYNDADAPYIKAGIYKRNYPSNETDFFREVKMTNLRQAAPYQQADGQWYIPNYLDVAP